MGKVNRGKEKRKSEKDREREGMCSLVHEKESGEESKGKREVEKNIEGLKQREKRKEQERRIAEREEMKNERERLKNVSHGISCRR